MSSIDFLPISAQDKSTSNNPSPARFVLTNKTDAALKLYWIDFDGKEVPYGEVAPRTTLAQYQTYSTHVWEVKDATGAIAFKFMPTVYGDIQVGGGFGLSGAVSKRILGGGQRLVSIPLPISPRERCTPDALA